MSIKEICNNQSEARSDHPESPENFIQESQNADERNISSISRLPRCITPFPKRCRRSKNL